MLVKFFEKLEKSTVLPWVGVTPFVLIPVAIMFNGDVSRGVGLLAFFTSIFAGMILGGNLGQFIATHILKVSSDIGKRLTAAFSAFGFGFVPALVGSFANAKLGTNIGMYSIGAHFFWACFGAGIFFFLTDTEDKK